jgi:two-component system sensor histidine kinase/response regulator
LRKPFRQTDIADRLVRHLGVQFVYQQIQAELSGDKPLEGQKPPDLAGQPPEWVAELRQAAIEADGGKIVALAEQVREQSPTLAAALIEMANNFNYETILAAADRFAQDKPQ